MSDERTTDSIMAAFDKRIREKVPTSPHEWVEAASYLNVLIEDEHDKLYNLEQTVAKMKAEYIKGDYSVAAATVLVETEDIYRDYRKQKARIGQIEEFIRIAKVQARLKNEEIKNY